MHNTAQRVDNRKFNQLRKVKIQTHYLKTPWGSVRIEMGNTIVHCAATVLEEVPNWMRKPGEKERGWITAEYSMLPYSSPERVKRESSSGKVSGRTQEIQRLIGRSLRAAVDMEKLGPRTIWIDCDVLQADGGTRTASITGSYVALQIALEKCIKKGLLKENPTINQIGAVSVGIVNGKPSLDLCYVEDSTAEVDMNVVMTDKGEFIEIQSTAEHKPFTESGFKSMVQLAKKGIYELFEMQKKALRQ